MSSTAWVQWDASQESYGLSDDLPLTDGSADFAHGDADGMNNWQEWVCGTCPTNPLSALGLLTPSLTEASLVLTWQSVAGVEYFLENQ